MNSLAKARHEKGWSQTQLACYADVAIGIVCRLERNNSMDVRLSTMRKLSNALEKPMTEVFADFFTTKF